MVHIIDLASYFSENVSVAALLSEARAETPEGREASEWTVGGEGWEDT